MKMFKTLRLASVLALAGMANAADYNHALHVNVPFAFAVAGQQFSPGDYEVKESDNGIITIQGEGNAAMVISRPLASAKQNEESGLLFTKSGNRDLLSIAVEGEGSRSIPVHSVIERELALTPR